MALLSDATRNRRGSSKWPEFLRDLGFRQETRLRSQSTDVHGISIHSRGVPRSGGAPFVLIHGLVISSLYMIPLGERLSTEAEVHAIDLPGFGRSAASLESSSVPELAACVTEWLQAMAITRCHLVANSLGCQIAAHVAADGSERVCSLTLIGATIDPHARGLTSQIFRLIRDALHEPPQLWANWFFDFCRAGIRRAVSTTRHMFRDRIEEQLPRITAPTLVLRGEKDPTTPQRWAEEIVRTLPRGSLVVIPGHGHCVHYTAPDRVAEAIMRHISAAPVA